ncbi:MAG: hypothetical protein MUP13_12815, partial [Thermoanaerobaculales bacterium]|nr:hypothetical protein [Thermoanaerobaculales bacterium]
MNGHSRLAQLGFRTSILVLLILFTPLLTRFGEASEAVTTDAQDQRVPATTFGQDVFLVVWEHEYSTEDHDVYFRLASSVGVPTGSSIAVATSSRWEGSPAVAFCADTGNFLVVWEEVNLSGNLDIRGQLYGSDGSTVGEAIEIATGDSEQLHPTIAWGDARWLVVWREEFAANPLNNDLHAILLENDGTPDGLEIVLASEDTDESAPAAAWGDDRFLVAWQDASAGEYDIVARTVTIGGTLSSVATLADWEYDQIRPAVAYSPENESYLVVWEDHHWGFGEDWDIYGRRVSTTGEALGGLVAVSWDGSAPRTAPAIAYDSGNAEYQVVWSYEPSEGNRDLWRRRLSPGVALIGPEVSLAALSSHETEPAAAGDGQYGYLFVWEDARDEQTNGLDIYAEFVEQFRLSGRVYAGTLGDTSSPLPGVTVELYCSQNQGEREVLADTAITDTNGWWGLKPPSACEFVELWMVDPQYHLADDASSVGGDVLAATWIEYPIPLRDKVHTGNLFFTVPQDPAPDQWRDFDPQSWWNSSLIVPISVEISDVGSGLDTTSAEYRASYNAGTTFTHWAPASCSGNNGSNGPETVSTSLTVEGDSGTQFLVQLAISDMAAQRSESPVYPAMVDTTPPVNPPGVSANISTSTWYGDGDITLSWQPATDVTSGVAGYSLLWDTSASTVPDDSIEDQDNHIEDLIPGHGQSWNFHLRTIDQAGNAAVGGVHTGPYWRDTTPPSNPTNFSCTPP